MIEVFGRDTSSNVQAVMWTIGELGLEHIRHDVGGAYGGTDTIEFRAMNPNGFVPTIRDGNLVLWESSAIVRYLAAQYGDAEFYPTGAGARASLDMWADWIKSTFYPVLGAEIFFPLVRNDPASIDQKALNQSIDKISKLAAMLDTRIGDGPWLAGEQFTFADIACGHLLYRYHELPFERRSLPNLSAYYERLRKRSPFTQHVMVSYEPLRWSAA